jgi:hypothetical protein
VFVIDLFTTLPPAAAARRTRPAPGAFVPRAAQEVIMNNEQPDWNFWCFITSLLELYLQLAAHL